MEVWILLFTVWAIGADGDFKASESRKEFPTVEECNEVGNAALDLATKDKNPAIFFCFKKGEKIG